MSATDGICPLHIHSLHSLMFLIKYWNINLYLHHVEYHKTIDFYDSVSCEGWWVDDIHGTPDGQANKNVSYLILFKCSSKVMQMSPLLKTFD